MYFNYHATVHRLIAEGSLIGYEILDSYHNISPCLLLYFYNHKPMPIREYRWNEYFPALARRKDNMKIYYTDRYYDEQGRHWLTINGDTSYDLDSGWTEESARADYESPEHAAEDYVDTVRAFGAYD